jgi:hypothetical protein
MRSHGEVRGLSDARRDVMFAFLAATWRSGVRREDSEQLQGGIQMSAGSREGGGIECHDECHVQMSASREGNGVAGHREVQMSAGAGKVVGSRVITRSKCLRAGKAMGSRVIRSAGRRRCAIGCREPTMRGWVSSTRSRARGADWHELAEVLCLAVEGRTSIGGAQTRFLAPGGFLCGDNPRGGYQSAVARVPAIHLRLCPKCVRAGCRASPAVLRCWKLSSRLVPAGASASFMTESCAEGAALLPQPARPFLIRQQGSLQTSRVPKVLVEQVSGTSQTLRPRRSENHARFNMAL